MIAWIRSVVILVLAWSVSPNPGLCNTLDSTWVRLELDLRGRWQQGNLNQIGIQPNLRFQWGNRRYLVDLQSNYQLLKASDFVLIDDFWTQAKLTLHRERSIYPMVAMNLGYALSYRIDHSFLLGVGWGVSFGAVQNAALWNLMFLRAI